MEQLEVRHLKSRFDIGSKAGTLVEQLTQSINDEIQRFNALEERPEKLKSLYKIYQMQQHIDDNFSDDAIAQNDFFKQTFHHKLYSDIKQSFADLGITSLEKDTLKSSVEETAASSSQPPLDTQTTPNLRSLIANLPPIQVNRLTEFLATKKDDDLMYHLRNKVYQPEDREVEGYDAYFEFLNNHSIEFFGGENSKNYKITNQITGDVDILKVENRLGRPKATVQRLLESESTQGIFAQQYEHRKGSFETSSREKPLCTYSLSVEEYCPKGDLLTVRRRIENTDAVLERGFDVFEQMGNIFIKIQENKALFPDAKNPNLLMNEEGQLVVADTKSIVSLGEDGRYNRITGGLLIRTEGYDPPEFRYETPVLADKAHAYILGKNLHQFLTGYPDITLDFKNEDGRIEMTVPANFHSNYPNIRDFYRNIPGTEEDRIFSNDLFKSPQGKMLKTLISQLVQTNPAKRPSVKEAVAALQFIKVQEQVDDPRFENFKDLSKLIRRHEQGKSVLMKTLDKIKTYQINEGDTEMVKFYNLWKSKIETAKLPMREEAKQLKAILNNLTKNHARMSGLSGEAKETWKEALKDNSVEDRALQIKKSEFKAFKKLVSDIRKEEKVVDKEESKNSFGSRNGSRP